MTPQQEADMRAKINPQYADCLGTESHERKMLFGVIDATRAQRDDLLAALEAIVELDDGDKPDLWHYEAEFDAARAAITKGTS
jgi:hypothetical protein